MSNAVTTAGWAILVMVAVTAIAHWPTWSAERGRQDADRQPGRHPRRGRAADQTTPPDQCVLSNPEACVDHRPPAVRASDTATEGLLYRNWLRGELGSADSPTAQKYGPALYDAKSFSWDESKRSATTSSGPATAASSPRCARSSPTRRPSAG